MSVIDLVCSFGSLHVLWMLRRSGASLTPEVIFISFIFVEMNEKKNTIGVIPVVF